MDRLSSRGRAQNCQASAIFLPLEESESDDCDSDSSFAGDSGGFTRCDSELSGLRGGGGADDTDLTSIKTSCSLITNPRHGVKIPLAVQSHRRKKVNQ